MKPLLSIRLLSLSFFKKRQTGQGVLEETKVLNAVSFDVRPGECLAIVGESGCGKSASLLSILGLHGKEAQVSGEIFFKGEPLHQYSEKQMRAVRGKKIALISQDPMSALNPTMKIGEQIIEALPAEPKKTHAEKKKRVIALLQETGISDAEMRSQQYPFEFSGGMLQRVAIAIALAGEPEIILADEPTTALDVTIQKQVLVLIKNIQQKNNMALVLVSHDLAVVAEVADRVMVMYAGELFEETAVGSLFENPLHPYTQALLNALPRIDVLSGIKTLITIEGQPPDLSQTIVACAFASRCSQAMNICVKEKPSLSEHKSQHTVRCWLYHEDYLAEQDKGPNKNSSKGKPSC